MLTGFILPTIKKIKIMHSDDKTLSLILLTSLSGWLAYGLVQYMFYIRSIQIFFWILLGFLWVILKPYFIPKPVPRRFLIALFFLVMILFYSRAWIILTYAIPV